MINVYLADKQVLFREGIHFTLSGEEDIEVVGETTDNEEALNFIETTPPNVAILNLSYGQPSSVEVTRRIKQTLPISVSVILVADDENEENLFAAMKCGASACITKDIDPDSLLQTIRDVAKGNRPIMKAVFRPGMASRIMEEFEASSLIGQQINYTLARLTPREADILRRISEGNTGEQLITGLKINEEALNLHLSVIPSKLAVNDQSRNLIEAVQRNMPSLAQTKRPAEKQPEKRPEIQYITRDEFISFRDSLRERLGSLFS